MMPLHRHAGEVAGLLPHAGEAVEEGGFSAVRRTNQRHRGTRGIHRKDRRGEVRTDGGLRGGRGHGGDCRRRFLDVSRRSAISLPSTRKTLGSPPGAVFPATMTAPGRNPSSMRRRATSAGRSRDSSTPASPSESSASVRGRPPRCRRRNRLLPLPLPLPLNHPRKRIPSDPLVENRFHPMDNLGSGQGGQGGATSPRMGSGRRGTSEGAGPSSILGNGRYKCCTGEPVPFYLLTVLSSSALPRRGFFS